MNSYMAISQHVLTTTGSGLQELEVISSDNSLTAAIQTDAVELYHHSGVVSEYKSGFCTVRSSGIG